MRLCCASVLIALLFASSHAAARRADDVDYVALGAQLVRDGNFDRAADMLRKVDPAEAGIDLVTYHTARGMIALERQDQRVAAEAFSEAIAAGQSDPLIHLHRAQAYVGLERHAEALRALDAAGDAIGSIAAAWTLRAHAQWMLGQRQAALDTLTAASERFAGNTSFLRRQVFYLIEAGLHQQAASLGREYLALADPKAADYAAIGTALRQGKRYDDALIFLERGRLAFPEDGAVVKALAQTWLERGDPLAAAEILAQESMRDARLLPEAAELFRRAGHGARALAVNARVADQERKLKQRVGILVQLRHYDQVAGMQDALYRAGLLADEDIRYALGYAHFRGGDFDAAQTHLAAIKRPELFRKATELRRLMQECSLEPWTCL